MMKTTSDSGITRSVWMDEPAFDPRSVLAPETRTDVCIIGAGISGLTTAYELLKLGRNVIVIDDGSIGGGETGRTTAHLTYVMDDGFRRLERVHGHDALRTIVESHRRAIDLVQTNVEDLAIDCRFRRVDGYLFAGDRPTRDLGDELETALRAGAEVYPCDRAPLPFETGPCLRFASQAELHPLAYLHGLARAITARGGVIHLGVHAEGVSAGELVKVSLSGKRTIFARTVVDATNATITSSMKIPLRQAPYRTYAVAFAVPRGAIQRQLAWDTADPYHYVRLSDDDAGSELLIVGGEDHRTGQEGEPAARWEALEEWTRARFPIAGPTRSHWSGQVMEPADGLAFIGKSPDVAGVYIVTGDSGQGMTHGTIAGVLLAELIDGREHPWAEIYSPQRSVFRGFGELLREAMHSGAPYADWFKPSEVESTDELVPGDGALVRRGLRIVAAYRDLDGVLHERSAVCPHLAGVVAWNAAEKTWDCPCHGSRFDAYGKVVNGPAVSDLERVEREKSERVPLRVHTPPARKAEK